MNKNKKIDNIPESKFSNNLNNINNDMKSGICDPKSSFGLLDRIINELNILYEQSIIGSIMKGKRNEKENFESKLNFNNVDKNNFANFRRNKSPNDNYRRNQNSNKNNENCDEENAENQMDIVLYGVISGIISGNLSNYINQELFYVCYQEKILTTFMILYFSFSQLLLFRKNIFYFFIL